MSNFDDASWEELRENVFRKPLARDEQRNFQMDLIKIEPNMKLEKHLHPDIEWVYVLKGALSDERGTKSAGDFFINEKDSIHTVTAGPEGIEILCCWCGRINSV